MRDMRSTDSTIPEIHCEENDNHHGLQMFQSVHLARGFGTHGENIVVRKEPTEDIHGDCSYTEEIETEQRCGMGGLHATVRSGTLYG